MTTDGNAEERRISGFENVAKPAEILGFSRDSVGQSYPQHYPHSYLPQGLPHFRSGPAGKLVFYRNQVVAWILQQQRKGGI